VAWICYVTLDSSLNNHEKTGLEREFCIRFFGSNDFCFATCERVFPYDLQSEDVYVNIKSGNKRLDALYHLALLEADQMTKILKVENERKIEKDTKPKFYHKVTQNRPVAPVKLKKPGEQNLEICDCSPNDASPCARDSNCINMLLNFECDKSCPAGSKCQNQKLRNRENVEIKILKTKTRGFGAVCVKDVQPDTFIIEYVGELIDNAELNRRMEMKMKRKEREFYFLTVESDLFVDAEFYANKSRFLNHSCDPNCDHVIRHVKLPLMETRGLEFSAKSSFQL
jgi:histone-lysine N-methyltransferase NSD2